MRTTYRAKALALLGFTGVVALPIYADADDTLYAAETASTFGTVNPNTGSFSFISNLPSGLPWPLGDAATQSDPIHGQIFSMQEFTSTGTSVLAINKINGTTSSFSLPGSSSFIIGYDNIGNKLIYAQLGSSTNNLYSYNVSNGQSQQISSRFSTEGSWQAGGIGAVNSSARVAYIFDGNAPQPVINVINLTTGGVQTQIVAPSGLVQMTLDEVNQKIIGLVSTGHGLELVSINVNTGVSSVISGIVGTTSSNYVQTISSNSSRYYFQSGSTITIVSTTTGAVLGSFNAPLRLFPVAQVVVGGSTDSTFANAINDPSASLVKMGSSTVTLTGASGFTGGTTVLGGTLSISSDANLGNGGTVALGPGTALQFTAPGVYAHSISASGDPTFDTHGNTVTYSGLIADGTSPGAVEVIGGGTLILDGINTYTGGTSISNSTLMVGDAATPTASVASGVTIGAGGTLSGYGTVTGNITNTSGGTIFPGGTLGTIGTLAVRGNYTQGATSTMMVEVSPTNASKLAVTGAAALAGTLKVVYDPGTYSAKTYRIVTATNGVSGQFGTVNSSGFVPTSLNPAVNYLAAETDLVLSSASLSAAAPTNNAVFGSSSSVEIEESYSSDSMVFDHLGDIRTGENIDGVKTSFAASGPMRTAYNGTQFDQFSNKTPGAHYSAWARGIGNWTMARSQGASPGYSSSAGGMLGGLDATITNDVVAGVAAGFTHTALTQMDGSSAAIDTPRVMLYGSYRPMPNLLFSAVAGLAYESINTTRPVAVLGANATEGHNGFEENLAVQGAYLIPVDVYSIIPSAGLQYIHHTENNFSESGANGFNLSSGSTHIDSLQPIFGVSVVRRFVTDAGMHITVEGKVSYRRELLSISRNEILTTASGALSPATSVTPARNTLTLGPTVTLQATDVLQVYANYSATLGLGKSAGQSVFVGARYDF